MQGGCAALSDAHDGQRRLKGRRTLAGGVKGG